MLADVDQAFLVLYDILHGQRRVQTGPYGQLASECVKRYGLYRCIALTILSYISEYKIFTFQQHINKFIHVRLLPSWQTNSFDYK